MGCGGGGCYASQVGKRREINAALKGAHKTPEVPQRWREEGECCKTVGRPLPFLDKEARLRKLRLGTFEFERFLSLTLIPQFDSRVLTTLTSDAFKWQRKKKKQNSLNVKFFE